MPVEVIERNLDGMAAVKLNVLHFHLTEDQGFRVESRVHPKLQGMGSDGFYYTQDQLREIVAYAAARGIRVVPEFDMPGHVTSWLVGHPELATLPGPYAIGDQWGIYDPVLDPTRDEVYTFLDGFLGEMARIFPDAYLHIGGDENNGKHWDQSPRVQAYKRAHGIADNHALQAHFTPTEREAIRSQVPWTRRVVEGRTTRYGESVDLPPFVLEHRQGLVMKPNDEYGGKGVVIGAETADGDWARALESALGSDWVVQEKVEVERQAFPVLLPEAGGERARLEFRDFVVDLDPYLFDGEVEGFLTRLSATSLANVTAGGGQVPSFVVEEK
jgi:hypothetical protein